MSSHICLAQNCHLWFVSFQKIPAASHRHHWSLDFQNDRTRFWKRKTSQSEFIWPKNIEGASAQALQRPVLWMSRPMPVTTAESYHQLVQHACWLVHVWEISKQCKLKTEMLCFKLSTLKYFTACHINKTLLIWGKPNSQYLEVYWQCPQIMNVPSKK